MFVSLVARRLFVAEREGATRLPLRASMCFLVFLMCREWIMKKKTYQRSQGKTVANDSKYSGRRRPRGF